jgi:stage V sporulation protein B
LLYGTLCSGILWLCSDDLCLQLYNSADAGRYLRWFSILAVMLYCDIITDAMIKGLGQQKISVRYNILTSSMDVAFLYILLPKYGIEGYYFSFLVTHVINFVLSLSRLTKITKIRIPVRIPILTLVAAIGSAWAASYVPNPLLRAFAFTALLFSALVLLRIIKKSDFLWFQRIICKK